MKTVFWAGLVEVGKIDTILPTFSLFGGDDNVGEAIRIVRFSDNIGFDELSHFLFYDFQAFRGELSSLLANWRMIRVGEYLVNGDDLRIYPRYVTL